MTATEPRPVIQQGRTRPVDVDAETLLPIDRTICPACLGQPELVGCKHCGDRPVCPTCRGAQQYSMPGPRLIYRTCSTCTTATGEFDQQLQWEYGVSAPDRKMRAIDAERARMRAEPLPTVEDPWTNYVPKGEG